MHTSLLVLKESLLLVCCLLLAAFCIFDVLYVMRLQRAKHIFSFDIPSFPKALVKFGLGLTFFSLLFIVWMFLQTI